MIDMQRAPKMPTGNETDIERVEIELADNGGATVRCHERQKPSKGNEPMVYSSPKVSAFGDVDAALAYVRKKLAGSDDDTVTYEKEEKASAE